MDEQRKPTPIYEMLNEHEQRQADDSITLQGTYQRYWEARDRERRMEARRNYRGLSVYERARLGNAGDDYGR